MTRASAGRDGGSVVTHLVRLLRSRRTAVGVLIAVAAGAGLGYVIPQAPQSLGSLTSAAPLIQTLQLDRVFTSWWYSALLGLLVVCSALSLETQVKSALRRTFGEVRARKGVTVSREVAERTLERARSHGYRATRTEGDNVRLTRDRWGHWGPALLHLGVVMTLLASWVALQSAGTGVVLLARGETLAQGGEWGLERYGLWARSLTLSEDLRLDDVKATYWPSDQLRQLKSELAFVASDGSETTRSVEVNGSIVRDGVRFYQKQAFGVSVFLTVTAPEEHLLRADIDQPAAPDKPAYEDLPLDDKGTYLRLKYLVDAEQESMSGTPELHARIERAGEVLGERTIAIGDVLEAGGYAVSLDDVRPWTQIIAVRDHGITFVFLGFAIILIGSVLTYVFIPRELTVMMGADDATIAWRAWRFADAYEVERLQLFAEPERETSDD